MKILAISDTHGHFEKFYEVCLLEKPEIILFSGDGLKEALDLEILFPEIKFFMVSGNCDCYNCEIANELIIELNGLKFFLTHGHMYNVKMTYGEIKNKGIKEGIDVFVFGHTHIPEYVQLKKEEKNLILFNPGAIINNCYGIIEILDNEKIKFIHKKLA